MARRKKPPGDGPLIAELARSSLLLIELEDHLRSLCRAVRLMERTVRFEGQVAPKFLAMVIDQTERAEQLVERLARNRGEIDSHEG